MLFNTNQRVIKVGTNNTDIGIVVEGPTVRRGQTWYKVAFGGRVVSCLEADLKPFVTQDNLFDAFRQKIFGGQDAFCIKLTLSKLFNPISDTLYSYNASRTELHAYQYKPLLKYLNSSHRRILIADEVGLGKTIEAGYILQEERARRSIDRVLIVCPASLRTKWYNEMLDRFNIRFDILNQREAIKRIPQRRSEAQSNTSYMIVSYESVRSDKLIEILEEYPAAFDMLIVDEAHHCRNNETKNYKLIEKLAETADSILFLSATPIHTTNKNLFNLLKLLLPEQFSIEEVFERQLSVNRHIVLAEKYLSIGTEEYVEKARCELLKLKSYSYDLDLTKDPYYTVILERLQSPELFANKDYLLKTQEILSSLNLLSEVVSRTRKRDVHENTSLREANAEVAPFTDYENDVYCSLIQHIYKQYQCYYDDQTARFILPNVARQIASSLACTVEHYQQMFRNCEPLNFEIEMNDVEEQSDEAKEGTYSIGNDQKFRELVNSVSYEKLQADDSKLKRLLGLLRKLNKKVIIFAFYKRSLRYLERRLQEAGVKCVRIDGDVPSCPEDPERDERRIRIEKFRNDPLLQVLLSSQVGSEGLDFQFCSIIINWDLPWNPMVVEQRIGRIDRLGQKAEKILIYNLVIKDTVEELILNKLYMRIGIFEESIGELEPILGPKIAELTPDLLNPNLTNEQKKNKIERSTKAVLNEKNNMLELEKKAAELMGHSEIIQQKLATVSRLGRFISGEHLERFVDRFLRTYSPPAGLYNAEGSQPDSTRKEILYLPVDNKLLQFFASKLNRYDDEEKRFRNLLAKSKIKITFHPGVALEHADAELIHSRHPLIMTIAKHYEHYSVQGLQSVFRLQLNTNLAEKGLYFWAWASIEEEGVFSGRYLKPIFLNLTTKTSIDDHELCEELLYNLLLKGSDWEADEIEFNDVLTNQLNEWAEDTLKDYVSEYRERRAREAQAVVQRKKQAIEATYAVLRERRKKAIETAKQNKKQHSLFEAQLKKIEGDYQIKLAEISSQEGFSVVHKVEGIGLLKIY